MPSASIQSRFKPCLGNLDPSAVSSDAIDFKTPHLYPLPLCEAFSPESSRTKSPATRWRNLNTILPSSTSTRLPGGHTLVVPMKEIDWLFDLDDETLAGLMVFAKRVAQLAKLSSSKRQSSKPLRGSASPSARNWTFSPSVRCGSLTHSGSLVIVFGGDDHGRLK